MAAENVLNTFTLQAFACIRDLGCMVHVLTFLPIHHDGTYSFYTYTMCHRFDLLVAYMYARNVMRNHLY